MKKKRMMPIPPPIAQSNQFSVGELATITEAVKQSKEYSDTRVEDRFRSISWITVGVVVVVFIAFIQMIISLGQINNAAFLEYSRNLKDRNEILDEYRDLLKINNTLLNTINSSGSADKK